MSESMTDELRPDTPARRQTDAAIDDHGPGIAVRPKFQKSAGKRAGTLPQHFGRRRVVLQNRQHVVRFQSRTNSAADGLKTIG